MSLKCFKIERQTQLLPDPLFAIIQIEGLDTIHSSLNSLKGTELPSNLIFLTVIYYCDELRYLILTRPIYFHNKNLKFSQIDENIGGRQSNITFAYNMVASTPKRTIRMYHTLVFYNK